ncbi:MAG TPA: GNVR domain-containing protein [Candidatus Acidoferrum sp.]
MNSGKRSSSPASEYMLSHEEYLEIPEREVQWRSRKRTAANLHLLWEHRRLLRRFVLYGFFASIVLAFAIPTRYESTTRLMPPDSQGSSGLAAIASMVTGGMGGGSSSGGGGLGGIAGDLLGMKSTSETFAGILSSWTVQDELIQKFNLKKVYWDRRIEDARKDLSKRTDIEVDRKSQIVSVTVTDHDPKRAAAMAQDYVEQLNRLVATLSTSSARRERMFLEGRLQGVNQELENAEREFSQYASKNSAIDIKEQGKAMVESAAMLQGQLIAAQSELEGLRQIYTDNNVRVRAVRARIGELQRQLEKIGGKGEDVSDNSSQEAALYPSIRKLPVLGVAWADLYRETKVREAVFETLTKQYELAKVQEAKEIPTVKVLDAPKVPEKKSFPPRMLIIAFGTTFAMCCGASWVFGKQRWEETEADDPRKMLAQSAAIELKSRLSSFSQNGDLLDGQQWPLWRRLLSRRRTKDTLHSRENRTT